jgi:hypothetical protein
LLDHLPLGRRLARELVLAADTEARAVEIGLRFGQG